MSVQENGKFNTSTANSLIYHTLPNIRLMLTAFSINYDKRDRYPDFHNHNPTTTAVE